jgi:WD40 repeat protein
MAQRQAKIDQEADGVSVAGFVRESELPVVTSLNWASDGSYLAVGNESGSVEIWDTDTAKRIRNMTGHLVSRPPCPSYF